LQVNGGKQGSAGEGKSSSALSYQPAASSAAPPPGGRFTPAHRSMTRLNVVSNSQQQQQQVAPTAAVTAVTAATAAPSAASQSSFDGRVGVYKSMTRLNSSQQNMARFSSAQQVFNLVSFFITLLDLSFLN